MELENIDNERLQNMKELGKMIEGNKSVIDTMPDIREKKWMNSDTRVGKILRYLIEAEDLLSDLDDYQLFNGQPYPNLEDLYNQLGKVREDFSNYVDKNMDLLMIDEDVDNYYQTK